MTEIDKKKKVDFRGYTYTDIENLALSIISGENTNKHLIREIVEYNNKKEDKDFSKNVLKHTIAKNFIFKLGYTDKDIIDTGKSPERLFVCNESGLHDEFMESYGINLY